ncbi:NAD(P)H-dependent oxidoreductase [Polaribacter sp.]|uniref:NAD(P)H-dependent oxidoreductase n=1 Tax=Polaribacter sp. TaxID=1920175 RepID=UPI0025D26455|nr:NAD(P)H-dependent oxidoreductase [Polaribacter sp.]
MNTIESLQWRYAVKKFNPKKDLDDSQINILKEAFNLTATSYGLQPITLLVIKNKMLREKLVTHSYNQTQVIDASHLLVICTPQEYHTEEVHKYFNLVQKIRKTEDSIITPFKNFLTAEIEKKSQEDLLKWTKNQAYLALGNLLTVCAIEKIDACPMEGFIAEKYNEVLELKNKNLTAVLSLPVGYRANDDYMKDLKKVRKNTNDIVLEFN